MAIINYDPIDSDFLKIHFRCSQCNKETEIVTPELPFKEETCKAKCGCNYNVSCKDGLVTASVDIVGLPDENVLSAHPIWWEHYTKFKTEYIDSLAESSVLERCVEEVSKLEEPYKTYLYGALWCRIISLLDVYCHYTIAQRVLVDEKVRTTFAHSFNQYKEKNVCSRKEIKELLRRTSFQSIDNLSNIFQNVFGFELEVVDKERLRNAVLIRNKLIHHQGRGSDGERYDISKEKLMKLFTTVCTLIDDIEKKIIHYDTDNAVK